MIKTYEGKTKEHRTVLVVGGRIIYLYVPAQGLYTRDYTAVEAKKPKQGPR